MLYALRHIPTGLYLTVSVTSNDAEDCNSYSAAFDIATSDANTSIWVTQNRAHAVAVMGETTPWYNSCTDYPQNRYVGQLEILELQPLA